MASQTHVSPLLSQASGYSASEAIIPSNLSRKLTSTMLHHEQKVAGQVHESNAEDTILPTPLHFVSMIAHRSQEDLFTTSAIDNIDHSSTSLQWLAQKRLEDSFRFSTSMM
ncbi:hypothetical protein SK128_007490 [Halocaridina rubra]|uniref:Uncharacterized protein n=1 Tax=Halocaridina rubra TaxID=373956 RepID=A0AAN9A337_HALRR